MKVRFEKKISSDLCGEGCPLLEKNGKVFKNKDIQMYMYLTIVSLIDLCASVAYQWIQRQHTLQI